MSLSAEEIKAIRIEWGRLRGKPMSQTEFGQLLLTGLNGVQKWESGDRRIPPIKERELLRLFKKAYLSIQREKNGGNNEK